MLVMLTWVKGAGILNLVARKQDASLDWLVHTLEKKPPHRVNGTAVFLTGNPHAAPSALLHNLKHNHMLHERNIILTIKTVDVPRVPNSERVKIESLSDTFTGVTLAYGFMETPNVERGLQLCRKRGLNVELGGDLVLPVAARAAPHLALAHAALAGAALHLARRQRRGRHHLLPDPLRPRGRDRHADRGVSVGRRPCQGLAGMKRPRRRCTERRSAPIRRSSTVCQRSAWRRNSRPLSPTGMRPLEPSASVP